ncbi:stalk domain-containing protein [Paenibacillus sp. NPDC058174]|uniref:stalk domain-containing protein n=1 Tax=Paenibacillus sp. NPDC058174 TaxID=3346366 RepID=UPI0036DD44B6
MKVVEANGGVKIRINDANANNDNEVEHRFAANFLMSKEPSSIEIYYNGEQQNFEMTNIKTGDQPIHIKFDGKFIKPSKPVIVDGRKRFLPMKDTLEQMGWEFAVASEEITITYRTPDATLTHYLHLKEESNLRIVDGILYIPMYYLGSVTDTEVSWDEDAHTINISTEETDDNDEEWNVYDEDESELSDKESVKVNYGKYGRSATLQALNELYRELEQEGKSADDILGFYPMDGHSGYLNTPMDVVAFGSTGMDGAHYGFLTDFGMVTDLEEAPIVLVSPMDFDRPAVVVANNIREFIRIVMIDSSLLYMGYQNEQDYLEQNAAPEYESTQEDLENGRIVRERLEERLHPPVIQDPYTYSEKVRAERKERIIVPTQDELGILNEHPEDAGRQHTTIVLDEDIGRRELETFLNNATYASKLALFRDYHLNLEQFVYHESGIDKAILSEMESLGLQDEIARIKANRP